jgi:hypothetical protein
VDFTVAVLHGPSGAKPGCRDANYAVRHVPTTPKAQARAVTRMPTTPVGTACIASASCEAQRPEKGVAASALAQGQVDPSALTARVLAATRWPKGRCGRQETCRRDRIR